MGMGNDSMISFLYFLTTPGEGILLLKIERHFYLIMNNEYQQEFGKKENIGWHILDM
jgi:hypothetical protein